MKTKTREEIKNEYIEATLKFKEAGEILVEILEKYDSKCDCICTVANNKSKKAWEIKLEHIKCCDKN